MEILITIGNEGETAIANDQICTGFYIAEEFQAVEKNNSVAGIQFDPLTKRMKYQNKVSKFRDFTFATTKSEDGYFQHILAPDIDEEGFYGYVESLSKYPEVQQMLLTAYALVGKINLGK